MSRITIGTLLQAQQLPGFTGSQGDLGYSGSVGYTGSQGIPGEAAALGYTGSQGAQGSLGYTGSQGIQGEQGDAGYTGSQGIAGNIGYTGSQGLIGYSGSQGTTGYAGSQGVPGEFAALGYTGSAGQDGTIGIDGYTGSQGIQGDIGYTGSQGVGYTGSQGTSGTFASFYANISSLPPSADIGTLAFVSDNSSIYAFNGSEWIDTNPNTRNFFYILQTNSFTGPITGNVGFTPTRTIQLQSLEANVATNTSTTIVLTVRKNNDTLQQFSLTGGQLGLVSDFSNNSVTTSDTIYLDITSGSGTDLVARFNYK